MNRKNLIRPFAILLVLLACSIGSFAQSAPFKTTPPNTQPDLFDIMVSSSVSVDLETPPTALAMFDPPFAGVGGRVVYRVQIEALQESVEIPTSIPAPEGLTLTPGGHAQTIRSIVPGKARPQTTLNFLVKAAKPGTYVIPPYNISVYGKQLKIPEARLTVLPRVGIEVNEAPQLICTVPRSNVYVGETVKVLVTLSDAGDGTLQAISQVRVNGDSIFSEVTAPQRQGIGRRNGRASLTFSQEVDVIPIKEGSLSLVAQALGIYTRINTNMPGGLHPESVLIDSDPFIVSVMPLPKQGELPGFTGAIGTFQIDTPKLSTNHLQAGGLLTMTLTVRGSGNLGRLKLPPIPYSQDWQTFNPNGDGAPAIYAKQRGYAQFSYALIPIHDRITFTPAIPFSYFDPAKNAYVDLTIPPQPVTIQAAPGAPVEALPITTGVSGISSSEREPAMAGLAETPIRTSNGGLLRQSWFLGLQLALAIGFIALWLWDRRRRYLEEFPEYVLRRRSRQRLRQHLKQVRRAAESRDTNSFVTGAINALREACAPLERAEPQALVCSDILDQLPATERQGESGQTVRRLFAAADALRFGTVPGDTSDLLTLGPSLEKLTSRMEDKL